MQLPEGMVAITSFSPMAVASRALLPGLEFPGAALVASLATTLLVLALMIALAPRAFRAE